MAKHGITCQQVATAYGCTTARINTILARKIVRPTTAVKLAAALGIENVEEILAAEE